MKTWFTIDTDNAIAAFPTSEEANATNPRFAFADEASLQTILTENSGLAVEIWNSTPGATPVKKFTSVKVAAARIWKAIQQLAVPVESASVRATAALAAKKGNRSTTKATREKKAPKAAKAAKERKPQKENADGLREGSKAAQVVELLKRENGVTLEAINKKFDWLPHTTRALMSAGGALAKAGFKVESFKTDKGERAYKIAS